MEPAIEFNSVCAKLGLTGRGDGARWGVARGHPIAVFLKIVTIRGERGIPGSVNVSATIQVSHLPIEPPAEDASSLDWGPTIAPLVARGNAKVMIEPRRSILFLFGAREILEESKFAEVIEDFLSILESRGVQGGGVRCHWCGQRDVPEVRFIEGRVTRICDVCVEERTARVAGSRALSGGGASAALIAAAVALIPSAVVAAGLQILWNRLMGLLLGEDEKHIHVPTLALVALVTGYGVAVAAPIGLILRRIPTRGDKFAQGLAFTFCLLASVLAEVLVVAWYIGLSKSPASLGFAVLVLKTVWSSIDIIKVQRVVLAVVAGIVAAVLSAPKVKPFFD